MFKHTRTDVCKATGFADVLLVFDIGNGIITDKRSFRNEYDAMAYLNSSKHTYIFCMLERYLQRQQELFADFNIYNTARKLKALETCLNEVKAIYPFTLKQICSRVQELRIELHDILPSINNPHYEKTQEHLSDILFFCKTELQTKI